MTAPATPRRGDLREGEVTGPAPERADASLHFIGHLRTPWSDRDECPKRGDPEAGPICRIELEPRWQTALTGIVPGDRLQLLYWMHLSRRDLLLQSPRSEGGMRDTFSTRSPIRPNPIASSVVRVIGIDGPVLSVRGLDCVDGTPLLDIKPDAAAFDDRCPGAPA